MAHPSISIIVPVYNVEAYIERCIRSVMNQTYDGALECLLVNDCGTDNSMLIVRTLVAEYDGAIAFHEVPHLNNRGLSAARNTGINAATGDYLFFLDSDDAIPSDCLEKLARPVIEDPTVEMVMGNREIISDGSPSSPETVKLCEADLDSSDMVRDYFLTRWLSVAAWNKLVRKDFLIKNDLYFQEGLLHEDLLWTHYVMKHLCHLYLIPDDTYVVYRRPQSITTGISEEERARHRGLIYEEIAKGFSAGEEAREAAHYLLDFCAFFCRYPKIPSYQRAAPLFRLALSDGYHTKKKVLLSLLMLFLRTAPGRWLVSFALKVKHCF